MVEPLREFPPTTGFRDNIMAQVGLDLGGPKIVRLIADSF
jgi:hypothetical protein